MKLTVKLSFAAQFFLSCGCTIAFLHNYVYLVVQPLHYVHVLVHTGTTALDGGCTRRTAVVFEKIAFSPEYIFFPLNLLLYMAKMDFYFCFIYSDCK